MKPRLAGREQQIEISETQKYLVASPGVFVDESKSEAMYQKRPFNRAHHESQRLLHQANMLPESMYKKQWQAERNKSAQPKSPPLSRSRH